MPTETGGDADSKEMTLGEAIYNFKADGYVEIFSTLLDKSFYMTKNASVTVPKKDLVRFTVAEVTDMKDLDEDAVKALYEAKAVFGGKISKKGKK